MNKTRRNRSRAVADDDDDDEDYNFNKDAAAVGGEDGTPLCFDDTKSCSANLLS